MAPQSATLPQRPQRRERRLEVITADVVEVHVDAVGSGFPQPVDDRPIAVVERRVETKLVEQVPDLLLRSGATDHPVTAELRDLRRQAADRARGRRDPDDVPFPQLRRVDEPGVRGHAHRAERPEVFLGRRHRGVDPSQRGNARQRRLALRSRSRIRATPSRATRSRPGSKPSARDSITSPTAQMSSIGALRGNELK